MQLPDSNVNSYFSNVRPAGPRSHLRMRAHGRADDGAGAAHLQRRHASTTSCKPRATGIDGWLEPKTPTNQMLDELYLAALSRLPTAKEQTAHAAKRSSRPGERRQALEDLYWGVLSSKEFLFNH